MALGGGVVNLIISTIVFLLMFIFVDHYSIGPEAGALIGVLTAIVCFYFFLERK